MVSIPDWTKFQRLHETQREGSNPVSLDRYYRQREEETIRQAENQGLLKTPTQEYILKQCAKYHGRNVKDVSKLLLVRLNGVHIRKIGELNYCVNLRICLLNNNFLTKIDGLAPCRQLIKLDLHSNQLSEVPGMAFWSGLRCLKFLHLHDNPLGKYENLQNIATCPNLIALTMYDTPLSLKRNYRHHVVNSVWTLKALDNYAVSDEEIIEDAMFGGMFSSKHPDFRITLHHNTPEHFTFKDELDLLRETECCINTILAHHSPVLIIQKNIRGFLSRKSFMSPKRMVKVKSADSNKLPMIPSDVVPPPPSSSPVPDTVHQEGPPSEVGTQGTEYESINKEPRQNSAAPSEATSYQRRELAEGYQEPYPTPMDMAYDPAGAGTPSEMHIRDGSPRKRKNLLINLAKLQAGTFSSLYEAEQIAIETILPQDSNEKLDAMSKKRFKKKKEKIQPRRIVKSVKQFFGPVVESVSTPEAESQPDDEGEETPVTEYRLRGYQPNIMYIDPVAEMIIAKQEAGRLVRDAEIEHHRRVQELPTPRVKSQKKGMNNDQRIFARAHGTMGMSCLYAVHQAYKDREKAEKTASKMEYIMSMREERDRAKERIKMYHEEKTASKMEYIMSMREERDRAKERIKMYHEEKRSNALKQRDMERAKTLENLEKREMLRLNYLDKRHEIKNKSADLTKSFRQDFTFVTEFSNQHTSVSNALMRHDRQAKVEDQLQQKSDYVQGASTSEKEQKDVVKKYLEHRQLMRQTESAMARATLDTRLLQEVNDRMLEAKTRVAQQKARRETVQAFYPLPVMTPVPTSSSAPPPIAHSLTRWDSNMGVNNGRVGKHHTLVVQ